MGLAVWKREGYVDDEGGPPGLIKCLLTMKEALQMFQCCLFPLWAILEVGIDASSRQ